MRVSFYLPRHYLPSAEKQLAWQEGRAVTLEQSGKIACAQAWIFQTWAALQGAGFSADLIHETPLEGILITITGCLPPGFLAPPGLFVAGIVADGLPHPGAHIHIVQNSRHARRLPGAVFMPLWPQPNLIPRSPQRGGSFERVAFLGDERNLAPELRAPAWQDALRRETGALLEIRGAAAWHDYHDVDAVVAVRDFRGAKQLHKPATKLYNAWLAGTPFVGGADSAYASDGHAGQDYLAARSPDEVLSCLRRIKSDPDLRRRLVAEGTRAAQAFTPQAITQRWRDLLAADFPARAAALASRNPWRQRCDNLVRRAVCLADRVFRD